MITLKSDNLDYYLEALPNKLLLIFASPTCPACKVVVPQIEKQVGDKIEILYIDGDKWGKIADQYNIEFYPTVILLKDKIEVRRLNKVTDNSLNKIIK